MTPPQTNFQKVHITDDPDTTEGFANGRGGRFHIPAGSGITSLNWYDYDPENEAISESMAEDPTEAVEQTGLAAGKSYSIPSAMFGAMKLYAVGNVSGTIVVTFMA